MSPDIHVGTRLNAACTFLGCTWVALIPAGALVRRQARARWRVAGRGPSRAARASQAAGGGGARRAAGGPAPAPTPCAEAAFPVHRIPCTPSPAPTAGGRGGALTHQPRSSGLLAPPPPCAPLQCTVAKVMGPPRANPAALALYCTVGPLIIGLLVVNRVASEPPALWRSGMISTLVFGSMVIRGYGSYPIQELWLVALGRASLAGIALGCGATAAAALLVLPSLASDEVKGFARGAARGRLRRPGHPLEAGASLALARGGEGRAASHS